MNLESGPARMDRIYWSVFTLACLAMAAYFFYDGKWGYLKQNREEAARRLSPLIGKPFDQIELGHAPTQADFDKLRASNPTTPEQVYEALGPPTATRREGPGATVELFASLYGWATVQIRDGRVDPAAMTWAELPHSKEEVDNQIRLWAPIALLIGLYTGFRAYRAATLRVVIDDQGMTYGGKRIPFEAMTSLRDYNRKGWIDLHYRTDAGKKRLRIDNQKVAKFEEIVAALCQAKGFDNPIAACCHSGAADGEPPEPEAQTATDDQPAADAESDRPGKSE